MRTGSLVPNGCNENQNGEGLYIACTWTTHHEWFLARWHYKRLPRQPSIFRSSSDKSVALYLLILLQSSVVIIHHVICIHTINLSEEGKQPPKRDSRVCLHCCIAFGSPQAVCALGLRCIVDVEFSRWRRRSRNFPGYMLYISIDIVLFWESYPQLHKLILI